MATFGELLGPSLLSREGEVAPTDALSNCGAVGLYFATGGVPECIDFTAKLAEAYNDALEDRGLVIVLVSRDASEADFEDHYGLMPWLALPFAAEQRDALASRFEVEQGPQLVILGPEGEVISTQGVTLVSSDPSGEGFPWKERATEQEGAEEAEG
eukprot:CAMPEP_0170572786 /NCGR_PEP_ID=MMETSP0224-20130122/2411_1 /TAXON_ID=285029 /ORGANISM="Togula jolla, Strain CCCM 725" /LENGTH=155 /DNA_ID=CAMNT_0010895317 /DNA_START=37 /DNA_END=500 /DNA_ORIENTATION=-